MRVSYLALTYMPLSRMSKVGKQEDTLISLIFIFIFMLSTISTGLADVGTATAYNPPYTPTACYGDEPSQFPSSNLFAAAGEAIWDNGAACGRQYLVRCISAAVARTCVPGQTIQIRIVDDAQSLSSSSTVDATTMVLSDTAFAAIADPSSSSSSINIEYQKV